MADSDSIKLCECGCGEPAPLAKQTDTKRGVRRGEPQRFIYGHMLKGGGLRRKHGQSRSPTYISWCNMIQRCTNPSNHKWPRYGARGITVCERWRQSFENFLSDMGPKPKGKTLDRRDNDGPYSPENCRWAGRRTQANNTSTNRVITAFGRLQTIQQWSRETGITPQTIISRLNRGWSDYDSVAIPTGGKPPQTHCKRGHPLSGENLVISNGRRVCHTCKLANQRMRLGQEPRQPRFSIPKSELQSLSRRYSDAKIGQKYGVCAEVIRKRRIEYGIQPHKPESKRVMFNDLAEPFR